MTDHIALVIANDRESYPNLSRASLTYCKNLTSSAQYEFQRVMGPRLEKLQTMHHNIN